VTFGGFLARRFRRTVVGVDTISGIPSHPLFVHIPAVLLPLAALGVALMVIKPAWHLRYRWVVLGVGVLGTLGAMLSANAGESLAEKLEAAGRPETWDSHAEAGDTAQAAAIVFVLLLAAYVLVPWWLHRKSGADASSTSAVPKWLSIALSVLVVLGAIGSVITVIDAGHSGAKSVWVK
jgi:vacuolar-type H+-ATPase subunit I/STV1